MLTITTPFSNRHCVHNHIYNIPTSNKSRSAYVLLYDKLNELDNTEELKKWLLFRKNILQRDIKEGILTCTYCGRADLVEGNHELHKIYLNNKNKNLATIDHIYPLSKGGNRYDEDNCCVSCKRCNQKKGNKII